MCLLYHTLLFWSILFLLTKIIASCKTVCCVPPAVASYVAYVLRLLIASCPLVLDLILCFVQLTCCPGLSAGSSKLPRAAWVCSRRHRPGVCTCTVWRLHSDELSRWCISQNTSPLLSGMWLYMKSRNSLQISIEPCYVLGSEHCPPGVCIVMTIMKSKLAGSQSTTYVLLFVGQA